MGVVTLKYKESVYKYLESSEYISVKKIPRVYNKTGRYFVTEKFMSKLYSEAYYINIGKEIYHLQALDTPDETFFLLKCFDKLLCTITMDEQGKWHFDNHLNEEQLAEVVTWIEKLFM